MNKTSRIYIAGHTGMVGSALVRLLKSKGYINLITRTLSELDLTHQLAVADFFQTENIDYVFLAAAKVGGIHANNTYPAQFIYENMTIQNNIIHSAWQTGVKRLLFLGSSCIYPKVCPQPMKEEYLLSGYLEPTNEPYAIAKIAGIKMCESYNRQYGTKFVAVMPTNLYGPNDNFNLETSHVLPAMIRKFHLAKLAEKHDWEGIQKDEVRYGLIPDDIKAILKTESSVILWGSGKPKREFLHVDDMAEASVFVMNLDDETLSEELVSYPKPCFVNLGAGLDCTILDLANIVKDIVGLKGKIIYDPSKPDGTVQKLLDVSCLTNLGWSASINLSKGIKRTYEWYIENA